MSTKHLFILFIAIGLLTHCGSGKSGIDPHLSIEEQQELAEVNLVGKWKLRPRNIGSVGSKFINNCQIEGIEFFEDRSYLLNAVASNNGDTLRKIYRGKYDLLFEENNNEVNLLKVVLMGRNYTSGTTFPANGSVATIDNIVLSDDFIQFRIQLGAETTSFCTTSDPVEVSGDKEDKVTEDTTEGTNNQRIQNEWRLIGVEAQIVGQENETTSSQSICYFLEDEFFERCQDETTGAIADNCPQAVSTTLIISGYGTYLFTYYDTLGNDLSTDQGDWRWRTDTEERFTAFEVKDPAESFAESATTITIISLSETTMVLEEIADEFDMEDTPVQVRFRYTFQLASLDFQDAECGDFTTD